MDPRDKAGMKLQIQNLYIAGLVQVYSKYQVGGRDHLLLYWKSLACTGCEIDSPIIF